MTTFWPPESAPEVPAHPLPDVAFYRLIAEHPSLASYGLTVDFSEEPSARVVPWLRIYTVRYLEMSRPGESTPIASVDVYAATHLDAAEIAGRIAALWPLLRKVEIPGEAYVSGAWVDVEPYRLSEPDPDGSGEVPARYHLEVGLRLHPSTSGA